MADLKEIIKWIKGHPQPTPPGTIQTKPQPTHWLMADLVDPFTGEARSMTPNELEREGARRELRAKVKLLSDGRCELRNLESYHETVSTIRDRMNVIRRDGGSTKKLLDDVAYFAPADYDYLACLMRAMISLRDRVERLEKR